MLRHRSPLGTFRLTKPRMMPDIRTEAVLRGLFARCMVANFQVTEKRCRRRDDNIAGIWISAKSSELGEQIVQTSVMVNGVALLQSSHCEAVADRHH